MPAIKVDLGFGRGFEGDIAGRSEGFGVAQAGQEGRATSQDPGFPCRLPQEFHSNVVGLDARHVRASLAFHGPGIEKVELEVVVAHGHHVFDDGHEPCGGFGVGHVQDDVVARRQIAEEDGIPRFVEDPPVEMFGIGFRIRRHIEGCEPDSRCHACIDDVFGEHRHTGGEVISCPPVSPAKLPAVVDLEYVDRSERTVGSQSDQGVEVLSYVFFSDLGVVLIPGGPAGLRCCRQAPCRDPVGGGLGIAKVEGVRIRPHSQPQRIQRQDGFILDDNLLTSVTPDCLNLLLINADEEACLGRALGAKE